METAPDYQLLARQVASLAEGEPGWLPVLANTAVLLWDALPDINWTGFYLMDGDGKSLVLGPFQGKLACMRIALGSGVCGTAAERDETQLVQNVHEFAGHIACDSASNSEVVIPIHHAGRVVGVLDTDSPTLARFSSDDAEGLALVVRTLESVCDWTPLPGLADAASA